MIGFDHPCFLLSKPVASPLKLLFKAFFRWGLWSVGRRPFTEFVEVIDSAICKVVRSRKRRKCSRTALSVPYRLNWTNWIGWMAIALKWIPSFFEFSWSTGWLGSYLCCFSLFFVADRVFLSLDVKDRSPRSGAPAANAPCLGGAIAPSAHPPFRQARRCLGLVPQIFARWWPQCWP